MAEIHVARALVGDEWRRDVSITVVGRTITAVAPDSAPTAGSQRFSGVAVPGVANVHSHAFQRAMAGLVERRGPEDDSFWTWREVMYRFLASMTPDDIEAVAAWAYVEMLEAGFTTVGEFHYLHNAPDGTHYADPAETGGRIVAAAEMSGIGLALLPSFYAHGGCGGQPPTPGQARFLFDLDRFGRLLEPAGATSSGWTAQPWASRRIRCAPSMHPSCARSSSDGAPARSTSTPPSRRARWKTAWPGPARGPCSGCWTTWASTRAGA